MHQVEVTLVGSLKVDPAKAEAYRQQLDTGQSKLDAAATQLVAGSSADGNRHYIDTVPNRRALLSVPGVLEQVLVSTGVEEPAKPKTAAAVAKEAKEAKEAAAAKEAKEAKEAAAAKEAKEAKEAAAAKEKEKEKEKSEEGPK